MLRKSCFLILFLIQSISIARAETVSLNFESNWGYNLPFSACKPVIHTNYYGTYLELGVDLGGVVVCDSSHTDYAGNGSIAFNLFTFQPDHIVNAITMTIYYQQHRASGALKVIAGTDSGFQVRDFAPRTGGSVTVNFDSPDEPIRYVVFDMTAGPEGGWNIAYDNVNLVIRKLPEMDLSIQNVEFQQLGMVNPDFDGDGLIDLVPDKEAQVSFMISNPKLIQGAGTRKVEFWFGNEKISQEGFPLNESMVSFQRTFIPKNKGKISYLLSVEPVITETNIANNVRPGSVAVRSRLKFLIEAEENILVESNPLTFAIRPSVYFHSTLTRVDRRTGEVKPLCVPRNEPKRMNLRISCINEITSQASDECTGYFRRLDGVYRGGHHHSGQAFRPWGALEGIVPGYTLQIPVEGLPFVYEAPEVSGEVDFELSGNDNIGFRIPTESLRFQVRIKDKLKRIPSAGLYFAVDGHEGDFGTEEMSLAVTELVDGYYTDASRVIERPHDLRSGGASLPWGGLFDIEFAWTPPHCSHRSGKTIDISFGTASQLTIRERAILRAHVFDSSYFRDPLVESNHYHLELK